jgi:N-acetylneuraminic acid mutarotase
MIKKELSNKLMAKYSLIAFSMLAFIAFSCTKDVELRDAWLKHSDHPDSTFRNDPVGFAIGGKAYVGLGFENDVRTDFWQYDPPSRRWSRKMDFPGVGRRDYFYTADDSKGNGYVGLGYGMVGLQFKRYDDIWQYDANTDKWTLLTQAPFTNNSAPISFVISNQLFVNNGTKLWTFDLQTKSWSQKNDLPFSIDYSNFRRNGYALIISSEVYVLLEEVLAKNNSTSSVWKYNPRIDEWVKIFSNFSVSSLSVSSVVFSILNKIYFNSDSLWGYVNLNDKVGTVDYIRSFPTSASNGVGVSIEGKGYAFLNNSEVWQYNP